ncbi:MAG: hypothetical protein A4E69_01877 [Syntrophus sp. PtaB.Bin138]|nr:MAG: hypothetical protein A4E69_01877 [Syntrophus sp. PtaB.Bin138]
MNNKNNLHSEVAHLMIDLGLRNKRGEKLIAKLASVLQNKLGKNISRNTLSMALSGYRDSAPYVGYLTALKEHLEECLQTGKDPVTIYTDNQGSQGDTPHHMPAQG